MADTSIRVGDMAVFRINGYRQMGFVAARVYCPTYGCDQPVALTDNGYTVNPDGLTLHEHQLTWGKAR
jgi:hypothetical protein